jgi:lipoate-protein ligase A
MESIARTICEAVADGVSRLGVEAKYRPRNDIEVGGRKVSGSGGVFDGDSLMYQGTLLLDMDVERMLKVLRIPAEKLSDKAISSARERVVGLRELLGIVPSVTEVKKHIADALSDSLKIDFSEVEGLTPVEEDLYRRALAEIDSRNWIYANDHPALEAPIQGAVYKAAGGLIRVDVALDSHRGLLKQAWITGDFFVYPSRIILDLEAAMKNTPIKKLDEAVLSFFSGHEANLYMLTPQDFIDAIRNACSGVGN